jgi:hypothetical protein
MAQPFATREVVTAKTGGDGDGDFKDFERK